MISIIVTAYREEKTIEKVIKCLLDSEYSGLGEHKLDKKWEFILVAPDEQTRKAALKALAALGVSKENYHILVDPGNGKPAALNMAFEKAKGDYLIPTDGEVMFEKGAVFELVELLEERLEKGEKVGGITGRPVSMDDKSSMMKYFGNLLSDAAHHKRNIDLTEDPKGLSTKLIPKRKFFPLSGYIYLIKNLDWQIPEDVLVDDAFISYELFNKGYKLYYAPGAKVKVKFPTNLSDYFKQKKRSTGGFIQLWKYNIVKPETKSRSFWRELEYFWFPIKYASNLKELIWSLMLYPIRLWLWAMIFWERKIIKKNFKDTWVRIESTK